MTEKSPRSLSSRAAEVLPREFFARPAPEVAPNLLGRVLWHDTPAGRVAGVIVEVEAYTRTDPASHSYRGKTPGNAVMFGPPGHAYVYFIYGMHFCMNLVCEPEGTASAVLLRAARVIEGGGLAAQRRLNGRGGAGREVADRDLARGPASLCQALGIDKSLNGADVCAADSPLGVATLVAARPPAARSPAARSPAAATPAATPPVGQPGAAVICTGPRVGISQAADVPWRFWLAGEQSVSTYRRSAPRRARSKPATGRAAEDGTMHR